MGLFDTTQNTNTTQNNNSSTNPAAFQMPYINTGLAANANALTQAQGASTPTGFTAQYTPAQLQAFATQMGYGMGNAGIAGASAAAGGALTGAGSAAAGAGLGALTGFQSGNTVGNVTNAAGAYSNNPDVQGMIDAATRDAKQTYSEQIAPGIERNAAASGNINSNRTGIAQGIAARGLANTVADTSANIRGGLYQSGLALGQTQAANADSANLAAASAAANGGTAAANAGVNANTGAVNQQTGLYGIANTGIAGQQAGAQADLTNQLQTNQFQTNSPFAALQNYWNIAGKPLGTQTQGTTTTAGTTTNTPSLAAQFGAGLGALSSLIPSRPS